MHQDLLARVLEIQHHRLGIALLTTDRGDLVVDGIETDGGKSTQGVEIESCGAGDSFTRQVDIKFELQVTDVDRTVAGSP